MDDAAAFLIERQNTLVIGPAAFAGVEHRRKRIGQRATRLCAILHLRLILRLCCAASGEQLI
jgi:hypothetical protein